MSAPSRKLFTALASEFKGQLAEAETPEARQAVARTIAGAAHVLASQAPSFDRERFMRASGLEPSPAAPR